ncbi:GrpB family protein [Candidatus Saccharibacteria bacterium]|jgi:glutamate-rich protein grpB|nr:GrpB family protein [Candidatus Saccharibacteria bacterium]
MSVVISEYKDTLLKRFKSEKQRLLSFLSDTIIIEHVGSSAVGIGGKNIIDILIGVSGRDEMLRVRDILKANGYFEGHDSHDDRIFLASNENETGYGDFHIHICPTTSNSYKDFILLRDFLISNPEKSKEYYNKKIEFANKAGFDRQKYKTLKSQYLTKLLSEIKNL